MLDNKLRERNFISYFTGLYNTNKLFINLENRINQGEKFVIISLKFTSVELLGKYLKYGSMRKVTTNLINSLLNEYGKDAVYSSGNDEIVLVVCSSCGYVEKCNSIIEHYKNAIRVDNYVFMLSMKIGIYEYQGDNETPIEAFNKSRIAYEQGPNNESGIYYYNEDIETLRRETIEISGSLIDAIKNNELYLVYQPKINIIDDTITGVEVLIRWDRGDKKPVGPSVFIKIAEDIGFITEISKFVIENTSNQLLEWRDKGIALNYAINITAKELLDAELISWANSIIEQKKIDRTICEVEITERMLADEGENFIERLHELKEMGYQVAIDDFGTGVNSLMRLVEIPYDLLKIDKFFIDRIGQIKIRDLIACLINYAHKHNKAVVAEGVETKEQLNILRELGCDTIQGYYYSKPILPHEFEEYYFNFYDLKR